MWTGNWLVRLMLKECKDLYMVDICHDENLIPYYIMVKDLSNENFS